MSSLSISLPTEDHTEQFGLKIAEAIELQLVIYLIGDLGAGKTTLTKGIAKALGISPKTVEFHRSNLLKKYDAKSSLQLVKLAGSQIQADQMRVQVLPGRVELNHQGVAPGCFIKITFPLLTRWIWFWMWFQFTCRSSPILVCEIRP